MLGLVRVVTETYLDDLSVAAGLIDWYKGVNVAKLRPGKWDHAARAVELHRATAQRDHRVNQAEILGLQVMNVAKHLGLRVMRIEDGVRKDVAAAGEAGRNDGIGRRTKGLSGHLSTCYDRHEVGEVGQRHTLVKGDANVIVIDPTEVDPQTICSLVNVVGVTRRRNCKCVEEH